MRKAGKDMADLTVIDDGKSKDYINPDHYKAAGLEAIEVIEAFFMDAPHLANAFKYLARCGKKDDPIQDLEKAKWYITRYQEWIMKERSEGQ